MKSTGKTTPERLAIIETIFENLAKEVSEIKDSIRHLNDKIELKNKVDDMHGILLSGNQPKTPLQKLGNTARDIKDIVIASLTIIALLALLLKLDFSAFIK